MKLLPITILFFCFFVSTFLFAQKVFDKEIILSNENDFYLLNGQDSYYTNGFFAQFNKATLKNEKKVVQHFTFAQTMFTTRNRRLVWTGVEPFDRPYCGYLFLNYTKDKFLTTNKLLSYSIEFGGTGDYALAQKLYEWYHKKLGLFAYPYWENQIPTSVGLNATIKFAKVLPIKSEKFQFTTISQATLGNYFINAKTGFIIATGKYENLQSSAILNATTLTKTEKLKNKYQLVYYLYPQLILQGYNATIQGEMNKTYTLPVITAKPQPIIFESKLGVAYAKKRIMAKAEYVFQSREVINQLSNHRWVGLHLGYKF